MDEFEKKFKSKIFEAFNNDKIPDLSLDIIKKHQERKTPWFKKKKFIFSTLGTLTSLSCILVLVPIGINLFKDSNSSLVPPDLKPIGSIEKNNQIAFGIFSGLNAIHDFDNDISSLSTLSIKRKVNYQSSNLTNDFNEFNSYMPTVESLINEEVDLSPEVYYYDGANYDYVMYLFDSEQTITIYFNETNFSDYDEEEEEFYIDGEIIYNENEKYHVIGQKELENDEYEVEFKIFKDINEYVLVEKEFESEDSETEISYCYSYYLNDNLEKEVEISFENEENKSSKVEFFMKNETSQFYIEVFKTTSKSIYLANYYQNENDENYLEVKINTLIENSTYYYVYQNQELDFFLKLKKN